MRAFSSIESHSNVVVRSVPLTKKNIPHFLADAGYAGVLNLLGEDLGYDVAREAA